LQNEKAPPQTQRKRLFWLKNGMVNLLLTVFYEVLAKQKAKNEGC